MGFPSSSSSSSALHVCLHFLLLFPVSQWKTPRVRPEGVSFGSKLNRTRLKKKKKKKKTLAGVQQVRCVYDNGRVSLVLLIAGGGFIGTGKRMRRRGDMKCVRCQGRFCELAALGPLSLSLPQQSPGAKLRAKSTLPVCGPLPAGYIVQCKRKLDLITDFVLILQEFTGILFS